MSKFRVNVCLYPPADDYDSDSVEAALAAAMAPFDMNLKADFNPDATWDWWRIDAGEGERFAVKPEHDGDPRLVHGDPDVIGYQRETLRCDGGPRGLLDFGGSHRDGITCSALLTLDGEWLGLKPYSDASAHHSSVDRAAYVEQSTAYLEKLDADCVVVRLLCHC